MFKNFSRIQNLDVSDRRNQEYRHLLCIQFSDLLNRRMNRQTQTLKFTLVISGWLNFNQDAELKTQSFVAYLYKTVELMSETQTQNEFSFAAACSGSSCQ